MVSSRGNRPLQGMRLLVRMAMSRSLGESMILHPTTPAALQPRPMAMVRHCCPQALHLWKAPSILKAARGRYPRSSSRVNRGKKMAMGGSMTDTIQATTRYTPKTAMSMNHWGRPMERAASASRGSREKNRSHSMEDG